MTSKKVIFYLIIFLYSKIFLAVSRIKLQNSVIKVLSEESKSDEEKKRTEREEESGLPQIGGSTIQDYSLSLREKRRLSMRSRNIRQGRVECRGLCFFSRRFFFLYFVLALSSSRLSWPLDTCSLR